MIGTPKKRRRSSVFWLVLGFTGFLGLDRVFFLIDFQWIEEVFQRIFMIFSFNGSLVLVGFSGFAKALIYVTGFYRVFKGF